MNTNNPPKKPRLFLAFWVGLVIVFVATSAGLYFYNSYRSEFRDSARRLALSEEIPKMISSGKLQSEASPKNFKITSRHGGIPYIVLLPVNGKYEPLYFVTLDRQNEDTEFWRFKNVMDPETIITTSTSKRH